MSPYRDNLEAALKQIDKLTADLVEARKPMTPPSRPARPRWYDSGAGCSFGGGMKVWWRENGVPAVTLFLCVAVIVVCSIMGSRSSSRREIAEEVCAQRFQTDKVDDYSTVAGTMTVVCNKPVLRDGKLIRELLPTTVRVHNVAPWNRSER